MLNQNKMAGEGDLADAMNTPNTRSDGNVNLSRLRERVREYIEKVEKLLYHLCTVTSCIISDF